MKKKKKKKREKKYISKVQRHLASYPLKISKSVDHDAKKAGCHINSLPHCYQVSLLIKTTKPNVKATEKST